ncbi:MAG: hypothetical protein GY861_22940, partial [bacterium]|nr:hypothetical protein [bacterium]
MGSLHEDFLAGYLGIAKTSVRILQHYSWDEMNQDIYNWCFCARRKDSRPGPKVPLHSTLCGQLFDIWGIDTMRKSS